MVRFLRTMRILTAVLFLASVLLICWQVIDIYGDSTANVLVANESIFRADDITTRLRALVGPCSAFAVVACLTAIVHMLAPGEAFAGRSRTARVYSSNKTEPLQHRSKLQVVILCTAIVFILLGVVNGGAYDVLVKAINICTECIGLG